MWVFIRKDGKFQDDFIRGEDIISSYIKRITDDSVQTTPKAVQVYNFDKNE